MGLIEKLKSVFGSRDERGAPSAGDTEVTVEYEPAAESEHAVKGTGEETEPDGPAAEEERRAAEPETAATESPPVDEIKGIGPTYSERLVEAGVETVADLAAADAETVAEATGASASRAERWVERARART